jgi:hypothetical protein
LLNREQLVMRGAQRAAGLVAAVTATRLELIAQRVTPPRRQGRATLRRSKVLNVGAAQARDGHRQGAWSTRTGVTLEAAAAHDGENRGLGRV